MKKNSGLTLAELLVIIVIIGIILTITISSISGIMKDTKKNIKETEMKTVYEGCKSYLNDVIEGDKTFKFNGKDYSGYSFLKYLAESCNSKGLCETSPEGDGYISEVFIPMTYFKDYVEADKFNVTNCSTVATIRLFKNSYGYYELNSINVDKDINTKAEKCVK